MKDVIGLVDCHTSPQLGELTAHRTLASTSFLGRYAFIDFALSNFCNSGIPVVGVLCRDHQRSLLKHMGNMLSWVNNTKTGRVHIFYNETGILNPAYNSDIANLRVNDWVLYDSEANYVVFCSPHILLNIDLQPVLEEHIARHEECTLVYKEIEDADKSFLDEDVLALDEEGYVESIHKNDGTKAKALVSLEIIVINRTTMAELTRRHQMVDASWGMREMLPYSLQNGLFRIHARRFDGYARCFDSLKHYVDYSFELLDRRLADTLFLPDRPIYTLTHDTPPALYGEDSVVRNSFISNGCLIQGEVQDSIICRNVRIGKKARVRRSIVLSNVAVGDRATLQDVVVDKYAVVTARHEVKGDSENLIYLQQGAIL